MEISGYSSSISNSSTTAITASSNSNNTATTPSSNNSITAITASSNTAITAGRISSSSLSLVSSSIFIQWKNSSGIWGLRSGYLPGFRPLIKDQISDICSRYPGVTLIRERSNPDTCRQFLRTWSIAIAVCTSRDNTTVWRNYAHWWKSLPPFQKTPWAYERITFILCKKKKVS